MGGKRLEVVKYLLSHPECPRGLICSGNKHDASCLHLACEAQALSVVEFLVSTQRCKDEGLLLHKNCNGLTCMHLAVQQNSLEVLKTLMDASDAASAQALAAVKSK